VLLDLLTVAVLGLVGARLAAIASRAARSEALRGRAVEIVRGLRLRHFLWAPLVLVVVVTAAVLLAQVPGLDFGWWTAIGGTGNVIVGSTERDTGGGLADFVPLVFLLVLLPLLPLLAEREEHMFRVGAESWPWPRRVRRAVEFGLIHLIMGIPIGVALALSLGGGYFTWAYLRGWRSVDGGSQEAGLLESTRAHTAYNGIVVVLALVGLALAAAGR
jgi:hypothetical protein